MSSLNFPMAASHFPPDDYVIGHVLFGLAPGVGHNSLSQTPPVCRFLEARFLRNIILNVRTYSA